MSHGVESFYPAFRVLERERSGDRIHALRSGAWRQFMDLGLPTVKHEEWRFTNLAPLAKEQFALGRPTANGVSPDDVGRLGLAPGLVFVDGHFRADLSAPPAGVTASSLAQALGHETVQGHLGKHARQKEPFEALNTAFLEDGAFVHVPRGVAVEAPIHVLYIGTSKAAHPRNLYVVEESGAATIVETYVSLGDEPHLTNGVAEISVGANARLEHYRLQLENDASYHVATIRAHQLRDSRFTSNAVTIGARLARNNITAALDAGGAECTLNGFFLTKGTQHADNHTWIEHRKPNCTSHELYKGVLDDASSGVFSGYIHVFEDAQKTDAYQSSKNLLLSDRAVVDSQPQLEIYADDVKCSHGSTTGQMDKDALFYLRTRGIREERARNMLIHAFAHDVTDRIAEEQARARLDRVLAEKLPG